MAAKFYECESCKATFHCIACKDGKWEACTERIKEIFPGTVEASHEKHIPVVTMDGRQVKVVVGEAEHPMIDEHYIEWIAIETKHGMQVKNLKPHLKPEAVFLLTDDDELKTAYAFCNLHGLWKKEA